MQRASPVIINSKDDFRDFTSDMLFISGTIFTRSIPRISLIFETHEAKYLDFIRVVVGEKNLSMHSIYHPLYAMDTLYLCGAWKFTSPVRMTFEFIIPVEKYHDTLISMAGEEFIGLGFIDDITKGEDIGYDVIAVPSIPGPIVYGVTLLDNIQMLMRADSDSRYIVSEMLR